MEFITKYQFYKPSLPKEQFWKNNYTYSTNDIDGARPGFTAYKLNEKYQYIGENIKNIFMNEAYIDDFLIWVQIIDPSFNGWIHKDPREFALLFILEEGGKNVTTNFYDDNYNMLTSQLLQANTWYGMRTKTNHSVSNIEDKRITLSISFKTLTPKIESILKKYEQ